ncbi:MULTISPECIES: hypothetical protein [Bradyrhizobium]|nr:hypothetical protein GCM10007858_02970 [Bradyrhizobium liaoningense]
MKTDVSAYGVTELSPEESSSTAGGFWPIVAIIAGVGAIIELWLILGDAA